MVEVRGEITSNVNMKDGLIKVESKGTQWATPTGNRLHNHIKNISLSSSSGGISYPDGPDKNADDNKAIHLLNHMESLMMAYDDGVNYHLNMSNINISGFDTGMHLRGWSNAITIRDVNFSEISAYGVWVSGCTDNSYARLNFFK